MIVLFIFAIVGWILAIWLVHNILKYQELLEREGLENNRLQNLVSVLRSKVDPDPETPSTEIEILEQKLGDIESAIELTQRTPAIVTSYRVRKRNDLERLYNDRRGVESELQKARSKSA